MIYYTATGAKYHTTRCQAVEAPDAIVRTAESKDELPDRVDERCGHCATRQRRVEREVNPEK